MRFCYGATSMGTQMAISIENQQGLGEHWCLARLGAR